MLDDQQATRQRWKRLLIFCGVWEFLFYLLLFGLVALVAEGAHASEYSVGFLEGAGSAVLRTLFLYWNGYSRRSVVVLKICQFVALAGIGELMQIWDKNEKSLLMGFLLLLAFLPRAILWWRTWGLIGLNRRYRQLTRGATSNPHSVSAL